jgi:hypothetical protein
MAQEPKYLPRFNFKRDIIHRPQRIERARKLLNLNGLHQLLLRELLERNLTLDLVD